MVNWKYSGGLRLVLASALVLTTSLSAYAQEDPGAEAPVMEEPAPDETGMEASPPNWDLQWFIRVKPALNAGLESDSVNVVADGIRAFTSFERQRQLLGAVDPEGDDYSAEGWAAVDALLQHAYALVQRDCAEMTDFSNLGERVGKLLGVLRDTEIMGRPHNLSQAFEECSQVGLRLDSTQQNLAPGFELSARLKGLVPLTNVVNLFEAAVTGSRWVLRGEGPVDVSGFSLQMEMPPGCQVLPDPPEPVYLAATEVSIQLTADGEGVAVQSVDAVLRLAPVTFTYTIVCPRVPPVQAPGILGMMEIQQEGPGVRVVDWVYTGARAFAYKLSNTTSAIGPATLSERSVLDLIWHPEQGGGDFGL